MLATLYGALTHLVLGGNGRQLAVDILTAWIGFAMGQAFGQVTDVTFLSIGPLNLLTGSLGAIFVLTLVNVLRRRSSRFL